MQLALSTARTLVAACREVIASAVTRLARDTTRDGHVDVGLLDREQVLAYDLSTMAGQVRAAEEMLAYGEHGQLETQLAVAFAGEVSTELARRVEGRWAGWGLGEGSPWGGDGYPAALRTARDPGLLEVIAARVLADQDLPRHLGGDLEAVRRRFARFAEDRVMPIAQDVHRRDADIPEAIIGELGAMGAFGLSVPQRFGGSAADPPTEDDLMAMVVVTEELSRGSLGVAGSPITRPEILVKALLRGGTPEQQQRWLPGIASGRVMCAIAVTEPDHGSDVGGLTVTATRSGEDYVVNGTKTWSGFAGRAELVMLLARTGTPQERHRGLSLFVVEKPAFPGHAWTHRQDHGGRAEARAISTIGYRGMHPFEIRFADYRVPAANLVGGDQGLGRGFYLQLDAFANGRLQTAARALGVMQAALEEAVCYANQRVIFGVPLASYQLSKAKVAKMACLIAACRVFTHRAAALLAAGAGQLEASMAKSLACLAAEWVTREAQQLHGGRGYAEDHPVSRHFVDARVLPIFEGADETLALRVIIRRLLEQAGAR